MVGLHLWSHHCLHSNWHFTQACQLFVDTFPLVGIPTVNAIGCFRPFHLVTIVHSRRLLRASHAPLTRLLRASYAPLTCVHSHLACDYVASHCIVQGAKLSSGQGKDEEAGGGGALGVGGRRFREVQLQEPIR